MSLITNPDYLSKDRLKSELKLHGVKFNQNENKPYYVNLYRKRVMDSEQSRHEFSSDEELTRSYKPEKKQQTQKRKKTIKIDTYLTDVEALIDQELKEELEKLGKDVGPITDTTRVVYQKMLARLMAENVTAKSGSRQRVHPPDDLPEEVAPVHSDSFMGEWSSDDSELEEEDAGGEQPPPPVKSPQVRREVGTRVRQKRVSPMDIDDEPVTIEKLQRSVNQKPRGKYRHRTAPKSTSLQGFMILFIVFIVAFFLYEHYSSTEDDPSLLTKGWGVAVHTWDHVKGYVIKNSQSETVIPQADEVTSNGQPPAPPTEPPTAQPPTKKATKGSKKGSKKTAKGSKTTKNSKKT